MASERRGAQQPEGFARRTDIDDDRNGAPTLTRCSEAKVFASSGGGGTDVLAQRKDLEERVTLESNGGTA